MFEKPLKDWQIFHIFASRNLKIVTNFFYVRWAIDYLSDILSSLAKKPSRLLKWKFLGGTESGSQWEKYLLSLRANWSFGGRSLGAQGAGETERSRSVRVNATTSLHEGQRSCRRRETLHRFTWAVRALRPCKLDFQHLTAFRHRSAAGGNVSVMLQPPSSL